MTTSATFVASFPAIQGAIKITGNGDGMRLQLDVPESEMAEAVKVLMWRECGLTVTIAPIEKQSEQHNAIQGRAKRKPQWATTQG